MPRTDVAMRDDDFGSSCCGTPRASALVVSTARPEASSADPGAARGVRAPECEPNASTAAAATAAAAPMPAIALATAEPGGAAGRS